MVSRALEPLRRATTRARVLTGLLIGVLVLAAGFAAYSALDGPAAQAGCPGKAGQPDGADGWGGCWPGPKTTGVPDGTRLIRVPADATEGPGWKWDGQDGIVNVLDDGAVLDGLDVAGGFYVRATGVRIRNSKGRFVTTASGTRATFCRADETPAVRAIAECAVIPGISDDADLPLTAERTVLEHSDIDYRGRPGDTGNCITGRNLIVDRVDIRGCENGFDADSFVTIRNSYIHDLYNSATGDPHTDGLQSGIGQDLLVEHNVFFGFTTGCTFPDESGSCNGTSALNFGGQPHLATVADTAVRRNLLAGGAYTLYCPILPPRNFAVSENRFSTVYSQSSRDPARRTWVGTYGFEDGCDKEGVTAVANRLYDVARKVASPLAFDER